MRVTLFFIILSVILGLILWTTLSGASYLLGLVFLLVFLIISIGYNDTAILFFLGAREIKGTDKTGLYSAAVQEAYKLAVQQPKLYFYNGALERAFVLQNKKTTSLIVSKDLLEICSKDELSAICFELLIQTKKNLAAKRTKVMYFVGLGSWLSHALVSVLTKIIPIKDFRQSLNGVLSYFIQPWLELFFKLMLGEKYFRRLEEILKDYPLENDLLKRVGSKLRRPNEIYSLSSKKMIEISSLDKSHNYQNIMTLEFLPHEWDLIFDPRIGIRA